MKHVRPGYIPFQYKLLISYVLLLIIPIGVIGIYSYLSSSAAIERNTRNNLEVAVNQISSNVQYRVDDIKRSAEELYDDQLLSRYLNGRYEYWDRFQVTTQYVQPRLESAVHLPKPNIRLTLYLEEPAIGEIYYEETEQALTAGERLYQIRYANRVVDEPWYRSLNLPYDGFDWKQVSSDEKFGYISLLQPMINYETLGTIGLIRVSVKLKDIFGDVDVNQLGEETKLFVLDENSNLLYPASMADFSESLLNDERYLKITKEIDHLSVSLVALIPYQSFKEDSIKVRNLTILICLLSLIVMTFTSYLIAKTLTKWITKLTFSLRSFKEGEYSRRIHYRGKDEFALIAQSFNDMASTTQKLIDEVYISKLEKKEAELQILHSQINPHFLYNTFSSISRMAKLGEINKLHEIIRELAKFYRLTLNKGEMLISVEKELQIIEAYMNIQNIKYADRINMSISADPGTENFETVKFILQPFVENVLEHAWYDDEITIQIRVFCDGSNNMVMEVNDNGLGMKQETVNQILGTGDKIGYGIRNVDQRIKLHYGKEYGVSLTSKVGEGTSVSIVLPKVLYDSSN